MDFEKILTQIIEGVAERTEDEQTKKEIIHAKNCAECRDRLNVMFEKGLSQLFIQPFWIEMMKDWSIRLAEHTKEVGTFERRN